MERLLGVAASASAGSFPTLPGLEGVGVQGRWKVQKLQAASEGLEGSGPATCQEAQTELLSEAQEQQVGDPGGLLLGSALRPRQSSTTCPYEGTSQ